MVHCARGLLSAVAVLLVMAEVGHSLDMKMELAFVVYRHGDRSPTTTFPKDKYQEDFWPQGFGQLSTTGMQQQYFLGTMLKKRYTSPNGFIYPNYTRVEVHIRSTNVDRTLMSAEAQLAGFFPPQGDQVFNSSIAWQPIPVHTVPKAEDNLLLAFAINCPRYRELRSEDAETQTYKDIEEENKDFFSFLEVTTGYEKVDLNNVHPIYDALLVEKLHGLKEPCCWVTPEVMSRLSHLSDYTFSIMFDSKEKQRLSAGVWMNEVLDKINEKTANPEQDMKLYLYSAHDVTVMCMMAALDLWNGLPAPYAAAFFVELYSDKGGNYFVSLFFRNETDSEDVMLLHVKSCVNTTLCTLKEFSELLLDIIPDDWEKECGLNPKGPNDTVDKGKYIVAAILAGAFALLVMIILGVFIAVMCCLHYRRIQSYSTIGKE